MPELKISESLKTLPLEKQKQVADLYNHIEVSLANLRSSAVRGIVNLYAKYDGEVEVEKVTDPDRAVELECIK